MRTVLLGVRGEGREISLETVSPESEVEEVEAVRDEGDEVDGAEGSERLE